MRPRQDHVCWLCVARARQGLSRRELAEIADSAQSPTCRAEARTDRRPSRLTRRILAETLARREAAVEAPGRAQEATAPSAGSPRRPPGRDGRRLHGVWTLP